MRGFLASLRAEQPIRPIRLIRSLNSHGPHIGPRRTVTGGSGVNTFLLSRAFRGFVLRSAAFLFVAHIASTSVRAQQFRGRDDITNTGAGATVTGTNAHATGTNAVANGNNTQAMGFSAEAIADDA